MPAEAGDAEGYAVNADPTSSRHGADADALLRATGRLETQLKLRKSSLDEIQPLLRDLSEKKTASRTKYLKLTEEASMLKAQLAVKRDHLVIHWEEHRTLHRNHLQCAKECASGQRTVSKLQAELENTKQAHKEAVREAKQKLAQDAKAALSAVEAEGALLQNAQVCFREVKRQFDYEKDGCSLAAQQAFAAARGSLSAEVQARLSSLVLTNVQLKTMSTQLEDEITRATSGAAKLRCLMERMEKNAGEADLKALKELIFEVVPPLVVVGLEQYCAQNAAMVFNVSS